MSLIRAWGLTALNRSTARATERFVCGTCIGNLRETKRNRIFKKYFPKSFRRPDDPDFELISVRVSGPASDITGNSLVGRLK